MRQLGGACVALLGAVLFASCGASLQSMTAGPTGCAPEEIQIADDTGAGASPRMWLAQCRGRVFQCRQSSSAAQSECRPAPAAPVTPPPLPPPSVTRVPGNAPDGSVIVVVIGELDAGAYHFHIESAPRLNAEIVRWTISGPPAEMQSGCRPAVMVDGVISDFTVVSNRVNNGRAEYVATLPMVAQRAMATGTRVVGRVCDTEWRLTLDAAAILRSLVSAIDEESARPNLSNGGDGEQLPL